MRLKITIIVVLMCLNISLSAQNREIMTNETVAELSNLGFKSDLINAKIAISEVNFDLSEGALQNLNDKNIPAEVILAMEHRQVNIPFFEQATKIEDIKVNHLPRHIFSVTGGLFAHTTDNPSNFIANLIENTVPFTDADLYLKGAWYGRISKQKPLYIGIGLSYIKKTIINSHPNTEAYDKSEASINYIQIPLEINYRFKIAEDFVITPSAGISLSYGSSGTVSTFNLRKGLFDSYYEKVTEDKELFNTNSMYSRWDAGINIGLSFEFNKISTLNVGYEYSLLNNTKTQGLGYKNGWILVGFGINLHN